MEVVYSYTGKLPSYIVEAVYQTRLFHSGKITLLCDDTTSAYLKQLEEYNVNVINTATFDMSEFNACAARNMPKFCIAPHLGDRQHLFILSFQRFFLLQSYMKQGTLTNVLFLELDVLLYVDPTELLPLFQQRELTLSYVMPSSVCSGFSYIRDQQILDDLTSYFIEFIDKSVGKGNDRMSEMNALSQWIQIPENKQRVWMLPGLWEDTRYPNDVWGNLPTFQGRLFDGAGIAIRVDGPDSSHREEWLRRGKAWWGTEVQYNEYEYEWRKENGRRILYLLSPEGKGYPVLCLHVHNKNLSAFLSQSKPPVPLHPFVNGDQFLLLANAVLRTKTRSDYYDVKGWDRQSLLLMEEIPTSWENPPLLFCNTEDLSHFRQILSRLKNRFVLLTHNSDTNITEDYIWLSHHPLLVHWFTQNLCATLPKTSFLPIGIANPTWQHGTPELFTFLKSQTIPKQILLYTAFRTSTNPGKREACKKSLEDLGVQLFPIVDPFENLKRTSASYFSLCPEGNGIDTHRFWEALLFQSVPVVLRSPFTESLQAKGYPCVLLNEWSDLTPELLQYNPSVFTKELEQSLQVSFFKDQIELQVKRATQPDTWAIVLIANDHYIDRALHTCREIRTKGNWHDAIVLCLPETLSSHPILLEILHQFQVQVVGLPSRDLQPILSKWDPISRGSMSSTVAADLEYAKSRPFIYMKFSMMSTQFRNWDYLFYIDAGCKIQGDLNRFKTVCTDTSCVYAHSDSYPIYQWKLRDQFLIQALSPEEKEAFERIYPLDTDYFQSTLMIFHRTIIQDTTVEELFQLAKDSPISRRMDQGILNLYFHCKKKIWKPLPLRDEIGFLYDYHPREGHTASDYCILKSY